LLAWVHQVPMMRRVVGSELLPKNPWIAAVTRFTVLPELETNPEGAQIVWLAPVLAWTFA
jgi:hypothetical protein